MLKSELSISWFTTHIRKPNAAHARSEIRKTKAQNDRAATNPSQNPSTYTVVSFQFTTNSIFPLKPKLRRSLLKKFPISTFLTARVHIHLSTRPLETISVTSDPAFGNGVCSLRLFLCT